jgi:hypothetical protein
MRRCRGGSKDLRIGVWQILSSIRFFLYRCDLIIDVFFLVNRRMRRLVGLSSFD